MRYTLFFLFLLLINCSSDSKQSVNKNNDLSKANLKASVSSTLAWTYSLDASNTEVLQGGEQFKYNEYGFEQAYVRYNADKNEVVSCQKKYDNQQQCIEQSCSENGIKRREIMHYEQDKLNNRLEIVNDETVRKVQYTYNKEGLLLKEFEHFSAADIKTSTHYSYNDQGQQTERKIYDEEGQLNLRYLYEYDSLGRQSMQTIADADALLGYKNTSRYNQRGDIEKSETYSGPKTAAQQIRYEYEYDEHNNWIKRKTLSASGILKKITYRTIEY